MSEGVNARRRNRLFSRGLSRHGAVGSWLHRYPCVAVASAAVIGVVADRTCFDSFGSSVLFWGILVTLVALVPWRFLPRRAREWLRLGATAVTVIGAFGLWHAWDEFRYRSASLPIPTVGDQQPAVVRGRVAKTVTLRPNPLLRSSGEASPWQSQLEIELDAMREGDSFRNVRGKVLVFIDGDHSELSPGDRLEVYGWLKGIAGPTNPGAADLRDFYRRKGLHARLEAKNAGSITVLERSNAFFGGAIAKIARSGRGSLLRHTDETTGPLAVALVIGQREFVDAPTRDALLATGTAHLLSVSGLHLAIIVLVAGWIISALGSPAWLRLILIFAISATYVVVTGNRPPVFRAAILVGALLFATSLRRTSQPFNVLGVAALALIVCNPLNVFAVGVHLSFLAVATLMLATRPVTQDPTDTDTELELELERESRFRMLVDSSSSRMVVLAKSFARFVGQMAWMSACVTAISLPLVWSQFHMVSLVSVLTNVLIWGGLMLSLPAGVFTVILDPVHPLLGAIPGAVCHWSLTAMWWVIETTSAIKFGHFWLPAPPNWMIGVFYAVIIASIPWRSSRARRFRLLWILGWSVAAIWFTTRPAPLPENTLEATFIDVGHGTSVVIRTPDSHVWLYDCGSMGNDRGTGCDIDSVLWAMRIAKLDGVFLSHADADHYNALPAVLAKFYVGAIYTPPGMLQETEPRLDAIRSAIQKHGVEVYEMSRGDRLSSGCEMLAAHPPSGGVGGSDNANSLVLRIDHAGTTLLLPGDLEPPGTESLISTARPIPSGVLMAPHHGSLSMDADAVLAWSRPGEVIISGGRRSARSEVREMLSVTGSGVHGTAESGAIRIRIDQTGKIEVRSWLTDPWR